MPIAYSAVPGFFLQDHPSAIAAEIGALPDRFGLIDPSTERWDRFKIKIDKLNAQGVEKGETYKVFFLGRHGQGWHNVAEAKYGTQAWDDHWSKLNGDDTMIWGPDPLLAPAGIEQALDARKAWQKEIPFGIPVPQRHYASPLKRALDTWKTIFAEDGARVTILEHCREEYGEHTCDKRSTLSHLRDIYPGPTYAFESGFEEEDPHWSPHERESKLHIASRALNVLDLCFSEDVRDTCEQYISVVAHGGIINGFLDVAGRPAYPLPTGGINCHRYSDTP
ncbi:histidine phosphatase superfamily [Irpex rosettiformis]|uniref:Histidine phosphatase superfamily n=1 Tax=Irpex rosettiformis TaxID=378272 RepID=A0ACB8U2P6_9APHY|nr:histidine phosphatase superfamily [Irpex rosettiformis]